MPQRVTVTVQTAVDPASFRVQQVAGSYETPPAGELVRTFTVDVPTPAETDWDILAIVGHSGSGKSSVLRQVFGPYLHDDFTWSPTGAMIDDFPADVTFEQIRHVLTAVGFNEQRSWIIPFRCLSGGEQFRATLARAILAPKVRDQTGKPIVAMDEFTTPVNEEVAVCVCEALEKAIRTGTLNIRLVACTCRDEILQPLQPSLVLNMTTQTLARGSLPRRQLELEVFRCDRSAWPLFHPHHYLDTSLHKGAECYLATHNGRPVAFCAFFQLFGFKNRRRITRLVTLPDYQGAGIGLQLAEHLAEQVAGRIVDGYGHIVSITASHPSVINHCKRSPRWRLSGVSAAGNSPHGKAPEHVIRAAACSVGRGVASFEYLPIKPVPIHRTNSRGPAPTPPPATPVAARPGSPARRFRLRR